MTMDDELSSSTTVRDAVHRRSVSAFTVMNPITRRSALWGKNVYVGTAPILALGPAVW